MLSQQMHVISIRNSEYKSWMLRDGFRTHKDSAWKSKRWCFKAELERTCHSLADCVQVLQISTWIWLASWPISSHVTLLISLVPRPCMIINHVHYLYIMLIIYISCSLFINHAHYLYILYISCSLFINHEHYS